MPPAPFKLELLPQFCTLRRCTTAIYAFDTIITSGIRHRFSYRCYSVSSLLYTSFHNGFSSDASPLFGDRRVLGWPCQQQPSYMRKKWVSFFFFSICRPRTNVLYRFSAGYCLLGCTPCSVVEIY
jgi:hypothetical protein